MCQSTRFSIDTILFWGLVFFVAGLYISVQEALEPTVTAEMVSAETLTISYGALGTVNGVAKFISSATVGVVWTAASPLIAFILATLFMGVGTLAMRYVKKGFV